MDPMIMMMMQFLPFMMSAMGGQGGMFGKPGEFQQLQTMNPEQIQMMQNIMGGAGQGMDFYKGILGGDQSQLDKLSAPLMRQFERETVPGIAGRFAAGNSMRGSAFQNSLGRAGTDLETNIGALQANLLNQAAGGLTGMAGMGMQPTFQNIYRPQTPGGIDALGQSMGGMGAGYAQGYGAQQAKSIYGA